MIAKKETKITNNKIIRIKYPSKEIILQLLKTGAFLSLVFIAPKAASEIAKLVVKSPWKNYQKKYLKRNLSELKKQGFITYVRENDVEMAKITHRGLKYAERIEIKKIHLSKAEKWDGKWRVVIFDIPNKFKKGRDYFRAKLKSLGLVKIQESVFVYPFPCFKELNIIREMYYIKPFVKFLVVDEIENDFKLKEKFDI